jgi:hypothetical protein
MFALAKLAQDIIIASRNGSSAQFGAGIERAPGNHGDGGDRRIDGVFPGHPSHGRPPQIKLNCELPIDCSFKNASLRAGK